MENEKEIPILKLGICPAVSPFREVWLRIILVLFFGFIILPAFLFMPGQEVRRLGLDPERIYRVSVSGDIHWTDTGFDVRAGQEIFFDASGVISLQQGNPVAFPCYPAGFDLQTVQQPLIDNNLGALIGKIVLLVSVEVDEETGEETRDEIEEIFHIGARKSVAIPLDGRLYLGINELVVADNSGEFKVEMQLLVR